jgi:hypothetical protein
MIAGASVTERIERFVQDVDRRVLMNDRRPIGPASWTRMVLVVCFCEKPRSGRL